MKNKVSRFVLVPHFAPGDLGSITRLKTSFHGDFWVVAMAFLNFKKNILKSISEISQSLQNF